MHVLRRDSTRPFRDRAAAGRELAARLRKYARRQDAIVLALPRGGVPVGFEVAGELDIDLDVILVRKLGVPGREELAMGAVATSGVFYIDDWLVDRLEITSEQISAVVEREQRELVRREQAYRDGRPPPQIAERVVICVDDGLATGASMRVAVTALRAGKPSRIVVAVPVAAPTVAEELRAFADEVIVARMPANFRAVSLWYENFTQTTDEEVRELLLRAAKRKP